MADEQKSELSEETLALAAVGRGEEPPAGAEEKSTEETGAEPASQKPQRPDNVPEKFWNAETGAINTGALLKSYTELEKARSQKQEEKPEEKPEEKGEKEGKEKEGEAAPISADLFSSAQAEWAEKGELTAETREKIIGSGIPAETLDTYLAGVAALSAALTASVYETAGGEDAYKAAVEWARENWSEGQITKFDAALNDGDLMPVMVKALMADYASANPGEGTQTRGGQGGSGDSDLYHDPEEFTRDLSEADLKNDALARRKAVEKLNRSKKAGTLKHVTPRSGVQALLG